jgi:hypothetical protein
MTAERKVFLLVMGAAIVAHFATPAAAQTPAVTKTGAQSGAVPDFQGVWRHPSLPGLEPLATGPTSLRNLSRRR